MKQQKKLFGKWGRQYFSLSPLIKVLFLLMLSLHGGVVNAQTDSGGTSPQNIANEYSALKQSTSELIEKLKSTNYGADFDALKGALNNLSTELGKENPSNVSLQQLTESAKAEYEKLKSNSSLASDVESLSSSFSDFAEKGAAAFAQVTDLLENGVAYAMPVTLPYLDNSSLGLRISFDSLRFVRGGKPSGEGDKTLVDVDAKFNFPFATSSDGSHIVHFHGKDIVLEGDKSPSRISLLSDHKIDLMKDKIGVVITKEFPRNPKMLGDNKVSGDGTWVEFDCDGVRDMCLCGYFTFSNTFITAATNPSDTVKAYFSFMYSSGMIAKVSFSDSFKVKGCGDFIFNVQDAIVDLSAERNANGFSLPAGYMDETERLDENTWSGFFLSKLAVTFPENLNFNDDPTQKPTLEVKNVLIDDYGFTGDILLRKVLEKKSDNGGLAISLDSVGVSFWQGDFSGGLIAGKANVPFLDGTKGSSDAKGDGNGDSGAEMSGYDLGFRGRIGYNAAEDKFLYSINTSLQADQQFKVPFTNMASITVSKDSYLEVGNDNTEKKFAASLCLNGSLDINSTLNLKGVRFEELRFSSLRPHISVKSFSLVGTAGFSVGGFGIELQELGLTMPDWSENNATATSTENPKDEAKLHVEAQISLMAGEGGIAAGVGLTAKAEYQGKWKVTGLDIDKIRLDLDFSAFHFKGEIERFDEDKVYGDGFKGSLLLALKEFGFGVQGEVRFGRVEQSDGTTKYWYTNATADLSGAKIMLFPPGVFLKSFSGGAYYHMARPVYYEKNDEGAPKEIHLSSADDYVPSKDINLGFVAGVGVYFMDPALCSANVEFEMNFNSNWGVNYVRLAGIASILKKMEVGATKPDGMIGGWLMAEYDRPNKTFHAQMGADLKVLGGLLKGQANMTIHSDPDEWYFWMGTRSNPNTLDFADLMTSKSYFMLGAVETPMPPMREKLAAQLHCSGLNPESPTLQDSVTRGRGFAFGIAMEAGAKLSIPLDIIYAHFKLMAGMDVLVAENHCSSSMDWRAKGQAYLSADGAVGASVYLPGWCKWHPCMKKKKFDILSGSVVTLMEGEIPSPVYVRGELHVKCKLFFIKLPKVDIGVSAGRKC